MEMSIRKLKREIWESSVTKAQSGNETILEKIDLRKNRA